MIFTAILGVVTLTLVALAALKLAAVFYGSVALRHAPRGASQDFDSVLLKSVMAPGISVVCVAPSASPRWRSHVRNLLDLHYGAHEVVLVVNGVAEWSEELRLVREERTDAATPEGVRVRGYYVSRDPLHLLVMDVEAPGAAKAWYAGVRAAQYDMIGVVDREAEFIPELLLRLIRPLLQDERKLAVCGLAPGPVRAGFLGRFSTLRTLCAWLTNCRHFGERGKVVLLPGATLLVKRAAILSVSQFGENLRELALELPVERQIGFVPMAVSWRRNATDWADLSHQLERDRWHAEAVFPALLETVALAAAVAGFATGHSSAAMVGLMLLATAGAGMVISMAAVVLRELVEPSGLAPSELAALFFSAIAENLGYRQLRNLWICLRGLRGQSGSRPVH